MRHILLALILLGTAPIQARMCFQFQVQYQDLILSLGFEILNADSANFAHQLDELKKNPRILHPQLHESCQFGQVGLLGTCHNIPAKDFIPDPSLRVNMYLGGLDSSSSSQFIESSMAKSYDSACLSWGGKWQAAPMDSALVQKQISDLQASIQGQDLSLLESWVDPLYLNYKGDQSAKLCRKFVTPALRDFGGWALGITFKECASNLWFQGPYATLLQTLEWHKSPKCIAQSQIGNSNLCLSYAPNSSLLTFKFNSPQLKSKWNFTLLKGKHLFFHSAQAL